MGEVKRVTTTKKSNKLIRTLLIVVGILGLILILVAIYFYAIKPTQEEKTEAKRECACYYIDPTVVPECGDPRKGFMFKTSTVSGTQSCASACPISNLPITELKSTTKQEDYLNCAIQTLQDTRCAEMIVTDETGKIITGNIDATDQVKVIAKFDKAYKNATFLLNNASVEPDTVSEDGTTIEKTFSDFTTPALDIVATAEDETGEKINSILCKRLLTVKQSGSTAVTSLLIEKRVEDDETTKISKASIRIANIVDSEDINILFSFGGDTFSNLSMTKGFVVDKEKGNISILEQELYNNENFVEDLSFSQFNEYFGDLKVTAEVLEGDNPLGKASTNVTFTKKEIEIPEEQPSGQEPEPQLQEDEEEESNFAITISNEAECIDRVEPNNSVLFTITIKNNATTSQKILSVKNKLPLGFAYLNGSSKINEVEIIDTDYMQINQIGDTEVLSWQIEEGWDIKSTEQIVIVFKAIAGENALTGENTNEVVIEPEQVPVSPDTLRASSTINVVQSCVPTEEGGAPATPETGIFDNIIVQVTLGVLIVFFGWYIYTKPFGQVIIKKLVDSEAYKGAEMGIWRIFKPRKYFEEIIVKKSNKKK